MMLMFVIAVQWDHMMDGWGWGMGLGWLISVGIVVLLAVVIWRLLQGRGPRRSEGSALEILKERYARGEIDREEFEAKKRDLARS